jgi:hypothetical protein
VATREILKEITPTVSIHETVWNNKDITYGVTVNGVPNVTEHLDYMTAFEEAREAVEK